MANQSWNQQINQVESIGGDRRADRRYVLRLDVRWKLIRRRRILEVGTGQTVDLSSGGVLFDANRTLPVGLNVELSITWPVLLHNVAPLQLVVSGRIVRANGALTAIRMVQHEFRTVGASVERRSGPVSEPIPNLFTRQAAMGGLR